jgi:hypothetical protein
VLGSDPSKRNRAVNERFVVATAHRFSVYAAQADERGVRFAKHAMSVAVRIDARGKKARAGLT